jgi:hypothetical protein
LTVSVRRPLSVEPFASDASGVPISLSLAMQPLYGR